MRLAGHEKKKVPILMYHSISRHATAKFRPFTVSPELFAEHMAYLYQHGYTAISVTQFIKALAHGASVGSPLPERPVVLTFDDGYADFFTEALPVLKRYSFVATLYVATAFVGGTSRWLQNVGESERRMLTWDQLIEISASGIECGGHSHSHPRLDTLPHPRARDEIIRSRRLLADHLEQEIFSFAYPYGYHTARVRQLVREAGYTSACAVRSAMSSETSDPFYLARFLVSADATIEKFASLLTGRGVSPLPSVYTIYARARIPVSRLVLRCAGSIKNASIYREG